MPARCSLTRRYVLCLCAVLRFGLVCNENDKYIVPGFVLDAVAAFIGWCPLILGYIARCQVSTPTRRFLATSTLLQALDPCILCSSTGPGHRVVDTFLIVIIMIIVAHTLSF
jgi:hypothetical protein